jgi:putative transposase
VGVQKKRRVAGMTRHRSPLIAQRHDALLHRVQALKAEHPCWGDRRIGAALRCVEQLPVHQKRGRRLLREPHVLVTPHPQLRAKRPPTGSKPRPTKPNAWWGIAMTKSRVEDFGWVSIVVVRDW